MKIFDKEVPAAWLEVLSTIQAVFPEAILAGGCLRDLVLGGEVKDLDVFIPHKMDGGDVIDWILGSESKMAHLAVQQGWTFGQILIGGYGTLGTEVKLCQEFFLPDLINPLQVIHMAMPEFTTLSVLSRMDFGACQLAVTADGPYMTKAAAEDILSRRITLLRTDDANNVARSIRRAIRFGEKYAGTDVTIDVSRVGHLLNDLNEELSV
jgi:hypothetical protein